MKLTPLAKALLFLIGLGLVGTAIYKFVPPEKLPWNRPKAAPAENGSTAPESTTANRSNTPGETSSSTRTSTEPWIEIPGGIFSSGQNQESVDVSAFKIGRTEVTNSEYEAFLAQCAAGSTCGPRELPNYWDDGQDDFAKGRDRAKGIGLRFWIETEQDLQALADQIKAAGYALDSDVQKLPWGPQGFALTDPDGFKFTISEPQGNS